MPSYWTQSGTLAAELRGAALWREETRNYYARVSHAAGTTTVKVYLLEADADADNANNVAVGTVAAAGAGVYPVTLTDVVANAPDFGTVATVVVVYDATPTTDFVVIRVDLGPRMERAVARVARFLAGMTRAAGYQHEPVLIEQGTRDWDDLYDEDRYPYVGIGQGLFTFDNDEERGGGGVSYTLELDIVAHDRIETGRDEYTVDGGALTFLHGLRSILRQVETQTYAGDGQVIMAAHVAEADPSRPTLAVMGERVTVALSVDLNLQDTGAEVAAP